MFRIAGVLALITATATAAPSVELRARASRATGSLSIDGRLDEKSWLEAPRQRGFTERFPADGDRPTFETSFAVLYDDDALYVGVWCSDPEPARVRRLLVRRDLDSRADTISIGIDSYHDRRTAYVFVLNAAGVQRDLLVYDDAAIDDTWDAVWSGDAAITDSGWTAELRIPLGQLRFADDGGAWGFQVSRVIGRSQEQSTWSPWPRTGPEIVSKFGVLDGLDDVHAARRLELLPYATAGLDIAPADAVDPLNRRARVRGNVGLDAKYGLGPAFTLSASINPDFGQVEADPSQVNLGPTELFFAEKRPFFLEGMDLFRLPIGSTDAASEGAFYSRRIGAIPAPPQVAYEFLAAPRAAPIYGAAKLTGKTASGWSLGALDVVTGPEHEAAIDSGGVRTDPLVAPLTNYGALRVKRDLRDGATSVGASVTTVDRTIAETTLADSLHDHAYTGGAQIQHRWDDNAWQLDIRAVGSWVHGSDAAIAATQTSNLHLFQRPDATDATYDPLRRSLSGFGATWQFGRIGATKHWRLGTVGDVRSPGLELNDLGFQTTSDRAIPFLFAQYHEDTPSEHVLDWQVTSDAFTAATFEPRLVTYGIEAAANVQLASYWNLTAGCNLARNTWDPVALRGGPALRVDPLVQANAGVSSDSRDRVVASLSLRGSRDLGSSASVVAIDLGATVQARSNIDVYLGPSVYYRGDPMQYIAVADDAAGAHHYVLGRVDEKTASLTTRVNWTFSTHASLQAYVEPFVAVGRYDQLKDVDAPHARRFADRFQVIGANYETYMGALSFANPDFDIRQLRSTVVLRWEYRPGSTVFAIWSHGEPVSSENLVMLKANFWVGL